jgi:hypothetical protein
LSLRKGLKPSFTFLKFAIRVSGLRLAYITPHESYVLPFAVQALLVSVESARFRAQYTSA